MASFVVGCVGYGLAFCFVYGGYKTLGEIDASRPNRRNWQSLIACICCFAAAVALAIGTHKLIEWAL